MAKTVGRNTNLNDIAVLSDAITLNSSTSIKVSDATPLQPRINFTISNPSSQDVWIKNQATSVDNDKKGIYLFKRTIYEMPNDNVYTGEISAIAVAGTPDVYVSEY